MLREFLLSTVILSIPIQGIARNNQDIQVDIDTTIKFVEQVYSNYGMEGLEQITSDCYYRNREKWICIYRDIASQRIDNQFKNYAIQKQFEYDRTSYFIPSNVNKRIIDYLKTLNLSKIDIHNYIISITFVINEIIDKHIEYVDTNEIPL